MNFSSFVTFGIKYDVGRYRSGQTGLTVNQLAYAFGGSNPSLPKIVSEREHDTCVSCIGIRRVERCAEGTAKRRRRRNPSPPIFHRRAASSVG